MSAISLIARPQPSPLHLCRAAICGSARSKRVVALLVATLAMSLADLAMTLTYATSVGMMELNPIARAVMATGSPWFLALWKLATVGLGLGILFTYRRFWKTEAATWLCFAMMAALTVHWIGFNKNVTDFSEDYAALADYQDHPHWVLMVSAK